MKKFAIHIHFFLTSKDAELIAYNNIKKLKKAGFTIIITSPKPLPEYFYEIIDYFFFDRENQLFEFDYEDIKPTVHWFGNDHFLMNFVVQEIQPHALAVLRSMIKGSQIAKMLKIDYIIRFEYDDVFGKESIKKLKNLTKKISDNNFDFYLYKNDYGQGKSDVSVHLMFYKADSFLYVFEKIQNETDYNTFLNYFEIPKKSILLEEFILRCLQNKNLSIFYDDGKNLLNEFHDTAFNTKQIDIGIKNGVLSDVMLIKNLSEYEKNKLCLSVKNHSSEEDVDVYFDIYDLNSELTNTIKVQAYSLSYWYYHIIDDCNNISNIKIRHNNQDHHKNILVYKHENQVLIKNPQIIGNEDFSQIIFR